MTTPSDTQSLILSRAATRPGNLALPLPEGLVGAAAKMVVGKMIARGWLEEVEANLRRGEPMWRETGDGQLACGERLEQVQAIGGGEQVVVFWRVECLSIHPAQGTEKSPGRPDHSPYDHSFRRREEKLWICTLPLRLEAPPDLGPRMEREESDDQFLTTGCCLEKRGEKGKAAGALCGKSLLKNPARQCRKGRSVAGPYGKGTTCSHVSTPHHKTPHTVRRIKYVSDAT